MNSSYDRRDSARRSQTKAGIVELLEKEEGVEK